MIGANLLRYNKEQLYVIFDKETCHLNLAIDNLPWQSAWLVANQYEILESHNYYINWGDKLKVSADAARATSFDPYLVKKEGKDPKEVYQKFSKYIRDPKYIIVGHNLLNFDVYVEKIWAEEIGESHDFEYINRLIDTNAVAKAIKKGIKPDKENFLAWQYKMIGLVERGLKTSLGYLSKEYQLEIDESRLHKADYDIIKNWEIFRKQLWEIEL